MPFLHWYRRTELFLFICSEPKQLKSLLEIELKDDDKIPVPEELDDAKGSNKLLVRNVPFQASQSEVLELFK